MQLYVVYLGGRLAHDRMGEDHEVVVVVAEDPVTARRRAKAQWKGDSDPHVDAVRCLDVVDGYVVSVVQADELAAPSPIDDDWRALNP